MQGSNENGEEICSNHEDCNARPTQIKLTKGFTAKEQMKGHTASAFFRNLYENKLLKKKKKKEKCSRLLLIERILQPGR